MAATPEVNAKILKQVEFYFSDVNIAKDTFLKSKMAESAEGWVPIAVLLTFKRLAGFVEGMENREQVIAAALDDSATVAVDKTALAVKRREAMPESITTDEQTMYAKPVPPTATLEELHEYFGQHGKVLAVWRRPVPGAKASAGAAQYKESVFVVFDSAQTVLKVVAAPPALMGAAADSTEKMAVMTKQAYVESKHGAKKASGDAARAQKEFTLRTPPMPTNSSVTLTACGAFEGFKAVKGLWSVDLQSGIRYVTLNEAKDVATVIFQDAATCDRMVADAKDKGATVNGTVPTVTRLDETADKAATDAAEKEITERAAQKAAQNPGGRGRGRGRGRGGRGGGFRGKRDRD